MTRPTLDGNELMQTAFSGFQYPNNVQVVAILGDGTPGSSGAVLQGSAPTARQASILWVAPTPADVIAVRTLRESRAIVPFVDHDGLASLVQVLEFSSSVRVGDFWDCTATLLQTSDETTFLITPAGDLLTTPSGVYLTA